MLADLDKVTFTILINDRAYRIRLTKDVNKNTIKGKFLSFMSHIKYLNKMTEMRFNSFPEKSNLLEKLIFLSSCCILLSDRNESINLRNEMLNHIFKKYGISYNEKNYEKIIRLEDYYNSGTYSFNNKKSLSTPVKYVDYKYLCGIKEIKDKNLIGYKEELKSKINLKRNTNSKLIIELKNKV